MNDMAVREDAALESLVAQVADEFRDRQQKGERPSAAEYADRHPEAAGLLRRVLTALEVAGLSGAAVDGDEPPLSGTLGDYRLVREVGRGGMGIVYEAEQICLSRRVALKVLPFAATLDPKQLQRFKNEAKAAGSLHHEHIVHVYGVGCERGVHYYAMQLIEGRSLAAMIDALRAGHSSSGGGGTESQVSHWAQRFNRSQVSSVSTGAENPKVHEDQTAPYSQVPNEAADTAPVAALTTQRARRDKAHYRHIAELIAQAADALEHAHSLGIVHRDVKPANLLLDGAGKLYVSDFGLARLSSDAGMTMTGDIIGTLRYMSPEQALAKHGLVDHRTDIYSLGATLYELVTLRSAMDGSDKQEILKRIAFDEPTAPRKLDRTIPAELETVALKALAKAPADRYASAGELADDLRRFVEDRPIQARRVGSRERLWRWCRRNPAVASLAAAVVLVFLAGFAGVTWKWQDAAWEAERSRRRLYVSDLNVVHQVYDAGNLERARELLDRQRPRHGEEDLRGFEWRYLWQLCRDRNLHTFQGHTLTVNRVTLSPDGKMLAVASLDDSVRLWDVVTRREVAIANGSALPSGSSVAFSADGKFLAVAGSKGLVQLWDPVTRKEIGTLPESEGSGRRALAFAPTGTLLAATVGREIRLWDVATQRVVGTFHGHERADYWSIVFSRNGNMLASAGSNDSTVRLWDVAARKQIAPLKGHKGDVFALAFSPDGKRLASGSIDGTVRIWNLEKPEEFETLTASAASVQAVAFSRDGKTLATAGGDGMTRFWDTNTRERVAELRGHAALIKSIAFAPDGLTLVTGSWDGRVKLWPVPAQHDSDTLTGHQGQIYSLAFCRDSKTLAVADRYGEEVCIWDVATRQRDRIQLGTGQVHRVAFAPDGQTLAIGSSDKVVLWNVAARQRTGEVRLEDECRSLDFSPDGKFLATGDKKNNVVVWALATGQKLKELVGANAQFSPDGTFLATGSLDGQVRLWDAATWQPVATFRGHPMPTSMGVMAGVWGIAFSPDGKLLATSGQDNTARLWDIAKKREVAVLKGHTHVVSQVAFAPDGKTLATSSWDATVKLWNLATHQEVPQEIATLRDHRGPIAVALAFAPDGNLLASADSSGTVHLWAAAWFQATDDPANRRRRE